MSPYVSHYDFKKVSIFTSSKLSEAINGSSCVQSYNALTNPT